jgi:hypothetical protein
MSIENPTKEELNGRNFVVDAVKIQDASNIIAVMGEMRNAARKSQYSGEDPRKDKAVKAIFFKVYDMLGAPSEKEMYEALQACELEACNFIVTKQ